jgi:hypothetical protein
LPLPGYPNFNPNNPPAGVNIFTTNRNNQIPTVQQYNLQVQQQFGPATVVSVAYVGNKTDHLATGYNYNTVTMGNGPALFPNLGQVIAQFNNGTSHYNSLQTSVNHRTGNNLTLTAAYTWSHNIDNSDGYIGYFAVSPLYVFNNRFNKGNSMIDQRNVFVASALYNLPFGKGQTFGSNWSRGLELVAGGWQLNTVVQAETGTPVSIVTPQYGTNYSPRATANGPIRLTHSITGLYFDTSNITATPLGKEGNIGRNAVFGPGFAEGDVSLFKTLHLTDRFSSELRAEVFNVTNTPQFQNPDSYTTDGNFGHITATRQYTNRQMQMAVRILF